MAKLGIDFAIHACYTGIMMTPEERKELIEKIKACLTEGGQVVVSTYARATRYSRPTHAELFSFDGRSMMVRQGRSRVCIDYCVITLLYKGRNS